MKNQHTQEFKIEKYYRKDCSIRSESKKYIPMFKYVNAEWTFALPIQTMYLCTVAECKEMINSQIDYDKKHGREAEYRLAEICNYTDPVKKWGKCSIHDFRHDTGEVFVKIDAAGTALVPFPQKNSVMLYNSAPLLEGIELLVKHGHKAVEAIKKATE